MANVTFTVPNKNGSYDGDMVVKQFTSLTINTGDVVTVDQPCRGMLIYVQNDCVINGQLSMTARGAYANPTSAGASDNNPVSSAGLRFPFVTTSGSNIITTTTALLDGCGNDARSVIANHPSLSGNGTVVGVDRQGANGGSNTSGSNSTGGNGSSGTNKTGGGGGGGAHDGGTSGSGSYGSCWSGGSGGGGTRAATGTTATPWGGNGGFGADTGGYGRASGGTGNPGGGHTSGSGGGGNGTTGTGGLLVLIVGGNLTIGSGAKIEANGVQGYSSTATHEGGGGSSGGGRVIVAYKGSYTNNGSIQANGGAQGSANNGRGGAGGNGDVTVLQVS
jgi:hypothetical protein